jgi:hypothetical protein
MELPQYKSHKIVSAAKIVAIDFDGRLDLMPHGVVEVGADWVENRHAETGGYYVVYEDGYASFSPAKAFEDGYSPAVVLTEGDAAADLAGTPRPDNPSVFIQPKITGYRQLTEDEVSIMNDVKALGSVIEGHIGQVLSHVRTQRAFNALAKAEIQRIEEAQPERWAAIARTHFQEGLMALTRAVAQPGSF